MAKFKQVELGLTIKTNKTLMPIWQKEIMRFIFLFIILLQTFVVQAIAPADRFERLSIEDGLSQSVGLAITQDAQGFMWFGTYDGLNRYDGYHFKHYRHDPDDDTTLSNNTITALFVDSDGVLWVGTEGGGLNQYNNKTQSFVHFRQDDNNANSLSHDVVTAINQEASGHLWVGTLGGGLNRLDSVTGHFTHFVHEANNLTSLSHNNVRTIYQDNNHQLWIGTQDGLNRLNSDNNGFVVFNHQQGVSNSLSDDDVNAIYQDAKGQLWIGTHGGGLNLFDSTTASFKHFVHDEQQPYSLIDDAIQSINEDSYGELWIGTMAGVSKLNVARTHFTNLIHQPSDLNSLSNNNVLDIYRDERGVMWLGTFAGGINRVDISQRQFGHFKHNAVSPGSLSNNYVYSIVEDSDGRLWVATDGGGLNRLADKQSDFEHFRAQAADPTSLGTDGTWTVYQESAQQYWVGTKNGAYQYSQKTGQFNPFAATDANNDSLLEDSVTAILKDANGVMWFGTWGNGVVRYDGQSESFVRYNHQANDSASISHDLVLVIFEDSTGNVWMGTNNGLNRYDEQQQNFIRYVNDKNDSASLSQGYVSSIFEDDKGNLWISTSGGLNKLVPNVTGFTRYNQSDGLANDGTYCVTQDAIGHLWVSSNKGLSRFNLATNQFKNYDVSVGLQSNEFNYNACTTSRNGELFFGGVNGFNRFNPKDIEDDVRPPKVVFTQLLLFNQPVGIGLVNKSGDGIYVLPEAIDQQPSLTFGYKQSLVSFEFAALDYSHPMSNQYAYKLVGFDDKWITADAKIRRATYTNLPAGDYTLRVKASNAQGYWNEQGASLTIHVKPAPWHSWWAYTIYLMLSCLVIFTFVQYRIKLNRIRTETAVEREVVHHLRQVDKLKDSFLANTSHELRTPLNGIIGLVESLLDGVAGQLPNKVKSNLVMVVASGRRLANLINDILDLSKLKHHGITLRTKPLDLRAVTDVVLTLSRPLVEGKNLTLVNDVPNDLPAVEADQDRLLQIMHNLVGNGAKFTDKGVIAVSAKREGKDIRVSVADTGIGIAADKLESIFDSFEQAQTQNDRAFGGTGLGLTITRQLVQLHGGDVNVESDVGEGSTFSFTLKASHKKAEKNMLINSVVKESIDIQQFGYDVIDPDAIDSDDNALVLNMLDSNFDGSSFRILIVDDEPINLQVLQNHLSMVGYQLVEAVDGLDALRLIEEQGPFDLVLLDVMMPNLSGYDTCKRIRQKYSVSDLPVIFLTARNQVDDLVEGFSVGANDHLNKPVAKLELLSRVETHLKLHDINRHLEHRVSERTAEVEEQKNHLEQKNRDILAAQQKLILSEKLASLGTLMAGVAHEINNPTHFVYGSVENLEVDLASVEQFIFDLAGDDADEEILESFRAQFSPLHAHIDMIKDGTGRIKTIVKDLKASSHMDDEEKSIVCITDTLRSTINLISAKYKHEVDIITDIKVEPVLPCYPAKLNQVFMNLIVNACDALKEKQLSGDKTKGVIKIGCKIKDDMVLISVQDNGCGMTEETKAKLFEPFYTTKGFEEGTGLGLSISYDIVQKHGGELIVESKLNVGTTFKLTLPNR